MHKEKTCCCNLETLSSSQLESLLEQVWYFSKIKICSANLHTSRDSFTRFWNFLMDIHRKSIVSRSTADILKIFMLCRL
jgi:hypothetical protein